LHIICFGDIFWIALWRPWNSVPGQNDWQYASGRLLLLFLSTFCSGRTLSRAVTPDTVFFDKGNSRAKLYCKWGSDQPGGTATDDNQIICIFH
jgi:hypothetical protein